MHELPGDAERALLASLPDVAQQIRDFGRRFETRQAKRELRRATQSITEAQAAGGAALPVANDQFKSVHQAAEAVRELTTPRAPADPGPAPGARP